MASEQLGVLVQMLRSQPVVSGATVAEMRAGMEMMVATQQLPAGLIRESLQVNGIAAEWLRRAAPRPTARCSTCTAAAT